MINSLTSIQLREICLQQPQKSPSRLRTALEVLAVIGPIICLVDCVVIPLALMILPLVGIRQIYHGVGDQILLFVILAICMPALTLGFLKHRRKSVLALMAMGFGLIFFANLGGHLLDETIHLVVTLVGSVLLIKANLDNKRLSKCGCHSHHKHAAIPYEIPVEVESRH